MHKLRFGNLAIIIRSGANTVSPQITTVWLNNSPNKNNKSPTFCLRDIKIQND
jgi:hypothetical protein